MSKILQFKWSKRKGALVATVSTILVVAGGSLYYEISPKLFITQSLLIMGTAITGQLYHQELEEAWDIAKNYQLGHPSNEDERPEDTWRNINSDQDNLIFGHYIGATYTQLHFPFIFEDRNSEYLELLRERSDIVSLAKSGNSEYESMLNVAAWMGQLWDHGMDPPPPDGKQNFKILDLIDAGSKGASFWCEVSARATTQVASALGWPSRLITLSARGYNWQHAVAEFWSNQFSKWFIVDTDFNVVYESDGIPLSAYELVHYGWRLKDMGKLTVRQFAPMKPFFKKRHGSLSEIGRLYQLEYNYTHFDMRNDWASRQLNKGSPAGGALATYYTSNDLIPEVYNRYKKAENQSIFDWPVNMVEIHLSQWGVQKNKIEITLEYKAFGPYVQYLETKLNDGEWTRTEYGTNMLQLDDGYQKLQARLVLENGARGPTSIVTFNTSSK